MDGIDTPDEYAGRIGQVKQALSEASTLIITLRGLLTEQAAQIEDKDKAIYSLKLDNERLRALLARLAEDHQRVEPHHADLCALCIASAQSLPKKDN